MELNPIFSDDRDECLAHYGVLGMKWGVWNEDTRKKRLGYREINKIAQSSASYDDAKKKMIAHLGNAISEETRNASKKYDDALNTMADYHEKIGAIDFTDHPVYKKAADKAAKEYIKSELAKNAELYPKNSRAREKLEEFAHFEVGYEAGKKAFDAKFPEYRKVEKAEERAWNAYYDSLKNDVDNLVKDNANKRLTGSYSHRVAKDLVFDALYESHLDEFKRS